MELVGFDACLACECPFPMSLEVGAHSGQLHLYTKVTVPTYLKSSLGNVTILLIVNYSVDSSWRDVSVIVISSLVRLVCPSAMQQARQNIQE